MCARAAKAGELHTGTWKGPIDELNRLGEQRVRVPAPAGRRMAGIQLLVAGQTIEPDQVQSGGAGGEAGQPASAGQVAATVPSVDDHEVVVLKFAPAR